MRRSRSGRAADPGCGAWLRRSPAGVTAPISANPPLPLRAGLEAATAATRALGRGRYLLADALGMASYAALPARRRAAIDNHRRLEPAIDAAEARRRARASFRGFARTGIDFLWACGMDDDEVRRNTGFVGGYDTTHAALDADRGGVLALTHFGNWDMAANIAYSVVELPLTTVMATTGPRAITDLVVWARRRNHLEVYPVEQAARGLLRALRRNRMVAILSDVPAAGPTVVVDYCGGPAVFSPVPAWLALRTGAPLFPTACWRAGNRYDIHAMGPLEIRPGDDEQSVMQRLAATVETVVRRFPDQWYPFRPPVAATSRPQPAEAVLSK